MTAKPLRSLRIKSGWREWAAIVVVALILHIIFFVFFKTDYFQIFQSDLPGEEGLSEFPQLDMPFSYVPLYERTETAVIAERPRTIEETVEELTFLDELGEPASELRPIEMGGSSGSQGKAGPRRTTIEPKPLFIPWPKYPKGFKGQRQGSVELLLYVNEKGKVENVKLVRGLPYEELNRIALSSARKIRFSPGMDKGVPAPMWVRLTIAFQSQ
jgi:TonB family protein